MAISLVLFDIGYWSIAHFVTLHGAYSTEYNNHTVSGESGLCDSDQIGLSRDLLGL